MGRCALDRQLKGKKSIEASSLEQSNNFLRVKASHHHRRIQVTIQEFCSNGDLDEEIRWVMNVVKKHSSYRSVEHDMEAMREMFPDLQICSTDKIRQD